MQTCQFNTCTFVNLTKDKYQILLYVLLFNIIIYEKEMDLRLSPLMNVIGRFEMDMSNSIGPRYKYTVTLLVQKINVNITDNIYDDCKLLINTIIS